MIFSAVISKFGLPVIIAGAGLVAGIGLQQKVLNEKPAACPQCPSCFCPKPTVSVQPFDVEKLKNIKTFTYSPDFTGSVSVAGVDSSSIRKYIDIAVTKAFEKYIVPQEIKKRKR
jgi:hypothetical protein